jgi:PilZ domain
LPFDTQRANIWVRSFTYALQGRIMQRTRYPERRRTTRLSLQVPLTVRCRLPEGETIDLKASTYVVSAHGALVLMDTPLIPGQTVKVFNEHTANSVDCVVTSLREKRDRRFVGIAFVNPNIDFWHIVFPKSGTRQAIRSAVTGALVPPGFRQENTPQF